MIKIYALLTKIDEVLISSTPKNRVVFMAKTRRFKMHVEKFYVTENKYFITNNKIHYFCLLLQHISTQIK